MNHGIHRKIFAVCLILACCLLPPVFSQGFYKDIFCDGGVWAGYFEIPAITTLGLSMEFLNTNDESEQAAIMISNGFDANGVLLYPDGEPRFRMIYTYGGSSTRHGASLGERGIARIRQFYFNGGSYSGSCGGCAIFSTGRDAELLNVYYRLWPGFVHQVESDPMYINHLVPPSSPLLGYRNFGDDLKIENVLYYGGNYPIQNDQFPENTEILLYFDAPGWEMDRQISCYAYKASQYSGRGVVTGGHPERCDTEERLRFTEAMFLYALAGIGDIALKGELVKGVPRMMDKETRDLQPAFTKIGDRQYHHFKVHLDSDVKNLFVMLDGKPDYDFHLYIAFSHFAYQGQAAFSATGKGHSKSIVIPEAQAGDWYIGVECASTVKAIRGEVSYDYVDQLEVLNGLAYSISADWETIQELPTSIALLGSYPNPFNAKTTICYDLNSSQWTELAIYNTQGTKITDLVRAVQPAGRHSIIWRGTDERDRTCASGIYFIKMTADHYRAHRTVLFLK